MHCSQYMLLFIRDVADCDLPAFCHIDRGNDGRLHLSACSDEWVASRPALLITTVVTASVSCPPAGLRKPFDGCTGATTSLPLAIPQPTSPLTKQTTHQNRSSDPRAYKHTAHSTMTVTKKSFEIASHGYSSKFNWGDETPNRAYSSTVPLFAESPECSPLHMR